MNDQDEAMQAVATLKRIGRKRFSNPTHASEADAVTMGLVSGTHGELDILSVAGSYLEDINEHLLAAVARQLAAGNATRIENQLVINLPTSVAQSPWNRQPT